MQQIRVLPSEYKGVVFRSRLEARWAALFDLYNIKWVYEPEGFETPSGNYLPDFYFPELRCYVEVKPAPHMFDVDAVVYIAEKTNSYFLVLDSPVVECRIYPLYSHNEKEWADMCWCASGAYLISRRGGEHRFYMYVGVYHDLGMTASEPCECGASHMPGDPFYSVRGIRFENGVAT